MYFKSMTLLGTEAKGDHLLYTHCQDVAPVIEMAQDLRATTDNGWTAGRNMQCIGEIPDVVFFNHPEFYNDDKALRRWLNSDEGRPYRIAELKNTTTSRIRMK